MHGLALARAYYTTCLPIFQKHIPDLLETAAFGLVGEGSECFGCDDTTSRDHDWGPSFCLWLPREELRANGDRIKAAFTLLPQEFEGYPCRMRPEQWGGRVGPLSIEGFYHFFTGLDHAPETWQEWLAIPEYNLAAATNGDVFSDPSGRFTAWRTQLLNYYPRDVYLKKLAARCMIMAQAGQYNLPRSLSRGDSIAAMLAAARFSEAALSLVYLLNKRYMPFYKWAGHFVATLPILGEQLHHLLRFMASHPLRGVDDMAIVNAIEEFCMATATKLYQMQFTSQKESWLWVHGPEMLKYIENAELRRMDLLKG